MNIRDLKVGDLVYIREDLEVYKRYGSAHFAKDMKQGVQRIMSIDSVKEDFNIASEADSFRYHYTPEMIDWEKTRRVKMDIKDLKVGDMVFIREDLEHSACYGSYMYINTMGSGIKQIQYIYRVEGFSVVCGKGCRYTSEMVDWGKTAKLNNLSYFKEIKQFGESGNEITKAVTDDGKEIIVKNNNEENDVEKAVMLLMLKRHGFTYGDVKKEVEKVKVKWIPKIHEECYTILGSCVVMRTSYSKNREDAVRLSIGNYFKTREEAERKAEEIKEVLKGE